MNNSSPNTQSYSPPAGGFTDKEMAKYKTLELTNSELGKIVKTSNAKQPIFGPSYLFDLSDEPRSGKTTLRR